MKIRESIVTVIMTALITTIFWLIVTLPMSRSEAYSILQERGTVIFKDSSIYIYLSQSPSVLELEATTILAGNHEGVYIEINQ